MTSSPASSAGHGPVPATDAWRFERRAMGSPLRLTLGGAAPADVATGAWDAVSARIEEVEEALSRFRATSALTALNARAGSATPEPVGRWLARALAAADRARRLTGGAFDARVLADLERLGYAGAALPGPGPGAPEAALSEAAARPGAPEAALSDTAARPGRATFADGLWLRLDPRRDAAAVATPVDLGGIGKGLALRWAGRSLASALNRARDRVGALLEAGGDLVATGSAPQGGPWLVGIEDPGGGEDRAVIAVTDGAVATSSVRIHAWTTADGRRVHHLLDPRTGEPGGEGLLAVTVAGPDPAWAEVWSKALFLQGARQVAPRARALGLAAWWIRADGALEMTPAARVRTAWLASEA